MEKVKIPYGESDFKTLRKERNEEIMKKIPIGRDNFKDIIEQDFYYVDKTKMIEELLERGSYVTLFPRPRRFGKSLTISMLDEFFNVKKKEENKNLFNGLKISKSKYSNEQGKYPVIKLNFKDIKYDNWDDMYIKIKMIIQYLYNQNLNVEEKLTQFEKITFNRILFGEASRPEYEESIKILSEYMYKYYGEKVILLIDEYDVPIQSGYLNGFYKEIVSFIKNMFSSSLKTNDNIQFAVMTGVLRVSKESIFSDLNNVKVYSLLDETYDEYFGFTEEETKELLEYYNLELTNSVKEEYDGYLFGKKEIYNPWSIINYASDKGLEPYWVNTGSNELITNIICNNSEENTKIQIEKLLQGEVLECEYNEKITFLDLDKSNSIEIILNFLLVSGYLTVTKDTESVTGYIKVKIPNKEVKTVYVSLIRNWFMEQDPVLSTQFMEFKENILKGNTEKVNSNLNKILQSISFVDTKENFYHGYMLGIFVGFLRDKYIVKSNREAGTGRFDVMIEKQDRTWGAILEFKIAQNEADLENCAQKGLEQINEKEYYKELELDEVKEIKKYAIAFWDKKCKVM